MTFESFIEAQSFFLWSTFVIAMIMGAVVNKTNFCTMGAVSDLVNIGDSGRFRAWLLAIAVAVLGVVVLEHYGLAQPGKAFPPYRAGQLVWAENILGGLLFGIGMTLASGCGNKCLIRIGGGNLKSVMVMLVIGVIAYFMINPFPGSDQTLYTVLIYKWISPLAVNVGASQGRPLSPQSFTFISPLGQAVGYAAGKFDPALLTFGVMAFLGVVAGSLLWSVLSRGFRIEWFSSFGDFIGHLVGAILMGVGGVLALGCTIGQAVTGISTLALGSFLTFGAIVLGSALTMKVQYYKMMYEDEASLGKALAASLADLHLLPNALRRLDKV